MHWIHKFTLYRPWKRRGSLMFELCAWPRIRIAAAGLRTVPLCAPVPPSGRACWGIARQRRASLCPGWSRRQARHSLRCKEKINNWKMLPTVSVKRQWNTAVSLLSIVLIPDATKGKVKLPWPSCIVLLMLWWPAERPGCCLCVWLAARRNRGPPGGGSILQRSSACPHSCPGPGAARDSALVCLRPERSRWAGRRILTQGVKDGTRMFTSEGVEEMKVAVLRSLSIDAQRWRLRGRGSRFCIKTTQVREKSATLSLSFGTREQLCYRYCDIVTWDVVVQLNWKIQLLVISNFTWKNMLQL